ncbi:MAG: NAD(P)H-binding protein [Acidobacteria bacterium]|nr:NAD(P)H-binding protein [Acidobacteriota bacterium]
MLAVTGATGQLGRLVMEKLLETVPADRLVAIVRNPAKAEDLASRGALFHDGRELSRLIGHSTTPLDQLVRSAHKA